MNGLYEYLLHETNINIDDTKTDDINIVETSNNKFTITRFENGFTLIKVNKMSIPLMEHYIEIYRSDLFSDDALSFIIKHFRLNSTHSPYEYIYGITSEKDLLPNTEVVSLASGYLDDFKAVELTGETLIEHRNKGYAKSNTLAITKYLLASGYQVFTTNGANNEASIQTIKSLGFRRYGYRLAFFEL